MRYFTVKEAADIWGIAESTIRRYCRNKSIPRAYKDKNMWKIPDGSYKPLEKKKVKQVLIDIVRYQNQIICGIKGVEIYNSKSDEMQDICGYLVEQGYVDLSKTNLEREIIYRIFLTEKGYYLLYSGVNVNIKIDDITNVLSNLFTIAISIKRLTK